MLAALGARDWDMVLSEFSLHRFGGLGALKVLERAGLDVPLILTTWKIADATAAEVMRAGARDYVLKDRLGRLVPVIERELRDAQARRAHRQAAEALRRSEAHFRALIETAQGLITIMDADGKVRYESPTLTRILGYLPEELVGRNALELIHPEDVGYVGALLASKLGHAGAVQGATFRIRHKDGSWRVFESVAENLVDDPDIRGVVVTSRDITEQRHAEEYRAQLATMVECSEDAIIGEDLDGIVTSWNAGAERMFGYTAEQMCGQPLSALAPEDLRAQWREILHSLRSGQGVQRLETQRVTREGRIIDVSTTVSPLRNELGTVIGFSEIARDVTLKKQEEAIQALFHKADQRLLDGETVKQTLHGLCAAICRIFRFSAAWIGLHQDDGCLRLLAHSGEGGAEVEPVSIRLSAPARGDDPAARTEWVEYSAGACVESIAGSLGSELARCFSTTSCLSIPLNGPKGAGGALFVHSPRPLSVNDPRHGLLQSLANQAAYSITAAQNQEAMHLQTAALEAAANAIVITNRAGEIQWVNPAFSQLTGYAREEVVGRNPRMLNSGVQSPSLYRELWSTILSGQSWHGELINRRKDGTTYAEEMTITPVPEVDGKPGYFVGIKQDVTERLRQESHIRHLALHDPLTNLANRRAMEVELQRVVERARRGRPGAMLLLDLDNFKVVNDTQGHPAGDQLLVMLAELLSKTVRPEDLLARLGGDEFALIMDDTSPEAARQVAERIRRVVSNFRFQFNNQAFELGVSIGVAPVDGEYPAEKVVSQADAALYLAKERGRNLVVLYEACDSTEAPLLMEASNWALRIKEAMRCDGFELQYQPIQHLGSGRLHAYEVLVRMRQADGRLVLPGAFIPAAERFGLMPLLDRWVLTRVLRVLQEQPQLSLFANLSGHSLADEELLGFIDQQLREAPGAAARLTLEITETVAISDLANTDRWIRRLQEVGCSFALDDFGVGFSSFSYLSNVPADYVKIDGSFVRDVNKDVTSLAVVRAVMEVAHAMGKKVIAEGIEDAKEADCLRGLGVEYGQGFAIGRPGALDLSTLGAREAVAESSADS
jgi:diguanylate cyclase (GGDEF)-like protein/PAS domain S-box-containing protein